MSHVSWGRDRGPLSSEHFSYFDLPDGSRSYTLTGVAGIDAQGGQPGEGRWSRWNIYLAIDIPDLPKSPPKKLQLIHWAPFFSLNSISNDGVATDAGWAVDDWTAEQGAGHLDPITDPLSQVGYLVKVAVSDSDGFLLRIGYNISLLGRLV